MTASNVDVYTCIYFLNDIFIILDCDTALSKKEEAKPQSERKQLGKITKIIMCTMCSTTTSNWIKKQ